MRTDLFCVADDTTTSFLGGFQVALRSFLSVRWLVKLGIYEENFKNILPLRTVSIESPLESLIGLTFAWDNFSLLQHLPSGYIDR